MKQGHHETVESLLEWFQSHRNILEQVGTIIGPDRSIAQQIAGIGKTITSDHCREAMERLDATAFLMLANKNRYEGLFHDLENEYLKDQDNYPRTLN